MPRYNAPIENSPPADDKEEPKMKKMIVMLLIAVFALSATAFAATM